MCGLTEQNPECKAIRIKVRDGICIYHREDISEESVSGLEVTWSVGKER